MPGDCAMPGRHMNVSEFGAKERRVEIRFCAKLLVCPLSICKDKIQSTQVDVQSFAAMDFNPATFPLNVSAPLPVDQAMRSSVWL